MDKTDFKKIAVLLEKKLLPIKRTLGVHTKILNDHTKVLDNHSKILDSHTKILNRHSEKLDALTLDVLELQDKVGVLGDIHENTKDIKKKVDELDGRVEILETAA